MMIFDLDGFFENVTVSELPLQDMTRPHAGHVRQHTRQHAGQLGMGRIVDFDKTGYAIKTGFCIKTEFFTLIKPDTRFSKTGPHP